jgi:hypothetical protein
MAESVTVPPSATGQLADVPKVAMHRPILFLGIGFGFLFLVIIIEMFKPGVITGPIKRLLGAK